MPIDRLNQLDESWWLRLYSGTGMLKTITLLKRGDDQAEGTVTPYTLFNCRRSTYQKSSEPIKGDMTANQYTTWHIPRMELNRIGIQYISNLDRIVEYGENTLETRTWEPESTTMIRNKLFESHICVDCVIFNIDNSKGGDTCNFNVPTQPNNPAC